MKKSEQDTAALGMPSTEEDTVAIAREVIGTVPDWYWRNKKMIEHNRAVHKEWVDSINWETLRLQEMLHPRQ